MSGHTVIAAELGPRIAAFTCKIKGQPTAVINRAASRNPVLRTQAGLALLAAGMDAGLTLGALHGIRR